MPSKALKDKDFLRLLLLTSQDKNKFIAFRDTLMYYVQRMVGLRPKEARCIKICHINFAESILFIPAENNKEGHSDYRKIPKEVIEIIIRYLHSTKIQKFSKWLFPSCHNKERGIDVPVHERIHQRSFTRRLKKLGLLHVAFIDKAGIPRYSYNLYSLRKRFGTECYKITKDPHKTRRLLRQRDKSCRSVWNYIEEAESEEIDNLIEEIYEKGKECCRLAFPTLKY